MEQNGTSAVPTPAPAVAAQPCLFSTKIVSVAVAQRPSWWLMQTPGSPPSLATHSASRVHRPQLFVAVLQMGLVGLREQSLSAAHSTQAPVGSQTGREPERAL